LRYQWNLKLIPPATITANSVDYNTNNPFISKTNGIKTNTDGSKQCEKNAFYARKDVDGGVVLNFITGDNNTMLANTKPIPDGEFKLELNDGTLIGSYNLSYGLPLLNNVLKVPIPALKLDVDSNNVVKDAWIKWYMYDGNDFNEIDINTLKTMISSFSIHGDDFNGISSNTSQLEFHCNEQKLETTYVDFKTCENYPDGEMIYNYNQEDKYTLEQIQTNIYIGATEYRFSYRK
jgi:hypothetical protein